jgi:hypothetical protein
MAVTCARPAASAVRAACPAVARASRVVRRAAVRVWRALDFASRCWRVAAARRAEALRAVLVRERLALVARRWPVERLFELVERLALVARRWPVERPFELVERLRVVLVVLRRAPVRLVLRVFCVAMLVAIPPPLTYCGKDISSNYVSEV